MPWSKVSAMDQRIQLVTEYRTGLYSMTELAAAYGVSRRIAYRWVDLCEREGLPFFGERLSARPSVDFGFGEVTDLMALNFEMITVSPPLNPATGRSMVA
jgi:predicted DNA-binding transcriptional regulator YafY